MNRLIVIILLAFLLGCNDSKSVLVYDVNDKAISVEKKSGHWTIINYWANWCSPCLTEIPELNSLSERFGKQVQILAVNPEQVDKETLKAQAQSLNIKYAVLQNDPGPALNLAPAHALPATYLISPEGQIQGPFLGAQTVAQLAKVMALKES